MLKDAHYTNPALKSHANFPSADVCACRCFLYAGSMQFLLVGLLAAGVDLGAVLLVTVAVNLRHIVEELKKYYGVGSSCRTICTVCGSPPCTTFSLLRLYFIVMQISHIYSQT